jgi:hypothetical protein
VWVADVNNACIRGVDITTGKVATLSGTCGTSGYADGTGWSAGMPGTALFGPIDSMIFGPDGALYTCEIGNTFRGIRRIDVTTGSVQTILSVLGSACQMTPDNYAKKIYYNDANSSLAVQQFNDPAGGPGTNPVVASLVQPMPESATKSMAACTDFGNANDLYTLSETQPVIYHYRLGTAAFDTAPYAGAAMQPGNVDGPLAMARFYQPSSLYPWPQQNGLLVTDSQADDVRYIDTQAATVKTLLGTPPNFDPMDGPQGTGRLTGPAGVHADGAGNIYVADTGNASPNSTIRMIDSSGNISTLAGSRTSMTPVDGTGTAAVFGIPFDMVGVGKELFVVDLSGQAIRQVDVPTKKVTTLAGQLGTAGSSDGFGPSAHFTFENIMVTPPVIGGGVATDGTNLYVADAGNHAIRQVVIATGQVSTLAGGTSGTKNGMGKAAQFLSPVSVAFTPGTLYVGDNADCAIRAIDLATANVTSFMGLSGQCTDTDGDASKATFSHPIRLIADGIGNLYVSELFVGSSGAQQPQSIVRRIDIAAQRVSTFAGAAGEFGVVPGPLPATLNGPVGFGLTPQGDLLVTNAYDGVVVLISAL